jgi:hypothetical protein
MSFGGLTNVGNFGSSALMNQKLNHALTGSEIAALQTTQKKKGMQILCTVTESGYTANHLYVIAADDTTVIDMGLTDHRHSQSGDGGFMYLIDRALQGLYYHYQNLSPTADAFMTTNTGNGGAITNSEVEGVKISTNTTSGAYATASLAGGVRLSAGFPSNFKVKLRLTSNTNFTQCRIGINAEHANETNTSTRKYLMEGCSASGVNWLIASSDNTTRTAVSTSIGVAQGGHDGYTLDSTLSNITAIFQAATIMAIKTSNLPVTSSYANTFRAGVKNTAGENKELYLAGLDILGVTDDPTEWDNVASPF